tara:strand:- start:1182 stop:1553 length:372 start_codon:yes stop_codon:yes gene_type:complete
MKKRESKLWLKIKKLKLKGQIFRVESNTINGIPDVYYLHKGKSIWIELKSNNVKNCGLSKYQINWHIQHKKNGGLSFILQEHLLQRVFKLYEVRETRALNLLAQGETQPDTLILHFDRMLWEN